VARIVSEIRDRLPELSPSSAAFSPSSAAFSPSPASPERGPGGEANDPEAERYRLLQAVTGFLRAAASVQPLVLVLEDLHDADRGTLDLLQHLARNLAGARLLIAGTYRDIEVDRAHPLSGALAELRRVANFSRVLLRGLTADEVQRMLSNLSGQDVSWSLAEAVHRQTEGNPLFIQEVLRYLVERLGKLSPECNRILAVAAVIGRDFALRTLEAVAGLSDETVVAALEEAMRIGVVEERARLGQVQYRFTHAFFRQTLYEELSAPRRIRLHQQVARALEEQYQARPEEHAAELSIRR
jgi:predicted ATPase